MRMATRTKRWIATGGATAAVAIGVWAAVALAAPTGLAITPSATNAPLRSHVGREGAATAPATTSRASPVGAGRGGASRRSARTGRASLADTTPSASGTYCYRVVGHYPGGRRTSATWPGALRRDGTYLLRCRADGDLCRRGGGRSREFVRNPGSGTTTRRSRRRRRRPRLLHADIVEYDSVSDGSLHDHRKRDDAAGTRRHRSRGSPSTTVRRGHSRPLGPATVAGGPRSPGLPRRTRPVTYRSSDGGPGGKSSSTACRTAGQTRPFRCSRHRTRTRCRRSSARASAT